MVRLAHANLFPIHTFYHKLLKSSDSIWNRDIDKSAKPSLFKLVSSSTGQDMHRIQMLSLRCFEGILFERLVPNSLSPWVSSVGVFHRTRKRFGLSFCAMCFKEDAIPYYRRWWRIAGYIICVKHECYLRDRCPNCFQAITFFRLGTGVRSAKTIKYMPLSTCSYCGMDLSRSLIIYPEWFYGARRQMYMDLFLHHRLIINTGSSVSNVQLFQGVRALAFLFSSRTSHVLRDYLNHIYQLQFDSKKFTHKVDFENLEISERVEVVHGVLVLLESWPKKFVEICSQTNITKCRFSDKRSSLPAWLIDVVDKYLSAL